MKFQEIIELMAILENIYQCSKCRLCCEICMIHSKQCINTICGLEVFTPNLPGLYNSILFRQSWFGFVLVVLF